MKCTDNGSTCSVSVFAYTCTHVCALLHTCTYMNVATYVHIYVV